VHTLDSEGETAAVNVPVDFRAWSPLSDPLGRGDEEASLRRIRATIDICEDMAEAVDSMRVREAMENEFHAAKKVCVAV